MSFCSVVVDDSNLCGEAPLWDALQQKLHWTDCASRRFYTYDWKSKRRELLLENSEVNGCALNRSGGFTFVNNSGAWFWDQQSKPVPVASVLGDIKLQLK